MGIEPDYIIEYMDGKTREINLSKVIHYENGKFMGTGVGNKYLMDCLKDNTPIVITKKIGTENIEEIINMTNIRHIKPIGN